MTISAVLERELGQVKEGIHNSIWSMSSDPSLLYELKEKLGEGRGASIRVDA